MQVSALINEELGDPYILAEIATRIRKARIAIVHRPRQHPAG
jgi:hypothetical protein